jgi:hypothetical protein
MRLVQDASSQMRRYYTDRRAQAHLSVQYSVVKCGHTASVLIHGGEASPIGHSHNTTMRSLPKYPCPCYPECPHLGKGLQLFHSTMLLLLITPRYVAHGLALLHEMRTSCVVRAGRCRKKPSFNIYNSTNPLTCKQLALITERFCPYMVPLPQAVKAEMRRCGSGKRDYRNLKQGLDS